MARTSNFIPNQPVPFYEEQADVLAAESGGDCCAFNDYQILLTPEDKLHAQFEKGQGLNTNAYERIVAIYDKDFNFVKQINVVDMPEQIVETPEAFTLNIPFAFNCLNYGCYRIGIADQERKNYMTALNENSQYDAVKRFASVGKWTVATADMGYDGTALGTDTITSSSFGVLISPSIKYKIRYRIESIDFGVTIQAFAGTTPLTIQNAAGTYEEEVSFAGTTTLSFKGTGVGRASIEQIIVKGGEDSWDIDWWSWKISYNEHPCTKKYSAICDQNAFGFYFRNEDGTNVGFSPMVRLNGGLFASQYTPDREVFMDSRGKRYVPFFQQNKKQEFRFDHVPEFVHDFMALTFGFDHSYIDDVEYHIEDDEYTPIYDANEMANFGAGTIIVSKKTRSLIKQRCVDGELSGLGRNLANSIEETCFPPTDDNDNFIVDSSGFYIISPTDSSRIINLSPF